MVYTLVFVPTLVSYIEFRLSWSLIRLAAAFQKVLGFISPTAVVAIPEFNKFLVHYEMALYSYPLDLVVRVSQKHSTVKTLEDSVERLAQKDGNVLFFRAGRIAHRALGNTPGQILSGFVSHPKTVVYATKTFLHVTLHILELSRPDENTQSSADRRSSYRPFGSVRLHTSAENLDH